VGIWIKSQDKMTVIKASMLTAVNCIAEINEPPYRIYVFFDKHEINVAAYETRERAMEVLDYIQTRIEDYERFKLFPGDGYINPVFEMPAE